MDDGGPLDRLFSAAEIDRLFAGLPPAGRIGVAVSGGPDSTALLVLADAWARRQSPPAHLHVLTVDHGLRAASAAEADAVLTLAARFGRPADKLVWTHDRPPSGDIQARARDARYRLIAAAAAEHRLDAVLLAHTLDDQAETFLMRLQRGSGVRGLAGMPERRVFAGVTFLRPLLCLPKARLVALVEALGIAVVDDPSNRSDRFLRARLRRRMPDLAALGLTAERIAGTARRMARADAALEAATDALDAGSVQRFEGVLAVDAAALAGAPDEIGLRLLARLLRAVRPADYPPRADALEHWLAALKAGTAPKRATAAGVVLDLRPGRVWLYAEAGRAGFPTLTLDADGAVLWDGRFAVEVEGLGGGRLTVGPASGESRRIDMPAAAAASLPLVRVDDAGPAVRVSCRWLAAEPMAGPL